MKPGKRLVTAVFLVDLCAFVLFFLYAAFERRADLVIPLYATRWEIATALLSLFRYLPAFQFLAVVLAMASTPGKAEDLLRGAVLPAIIVTALLAATALIAGPSLESTKGVLGTNSRRYNQALEDANLAIDQGRVDDARADWGIIEAIDRNDIRANALKERLLGAELKEGRAKAAAAEPLPQPAPDKEAGAAELAAAQSAIRQRDWYGAFWHATRASEYDPGLGLAKRLAKQAWGEILDSGGGSDPARATFFSRKMEAYGRLQAGDPVTAYRLFLDLAAESPGDADVRRYLAESLGNIEKTAFFRDEADEAAKARIFPSFFIILPSEDGGLRALAAREVAFSPAAAFFFDLEYLEADKGGRLVTQVFAPYAKLVEGRILLEAVERNKPRLVFAPRLVPGPSRPGQRAPLFLEAALDPVTTYRLAAASRLPASATVLDLFEAASAAARYRIDSTPFLLELLRRLGLPFALFAASVLATLLGIRFRDPERRPTRASWLALPGFLLVSLAGWLAMDYADGLISLWILRFVPGPASLVASAGTRAVILAVLILLVASLREAPALETEV
jgi:hypothetical protein